MDDNGRLLLGLTVFCGVIILGATLLFAPHYENMEPTVEKWEPTPISEMERKAMCAADHTKCGGGPR